MEWGEGSLEFQIRRESHSLLTAKVLSGTSICLGPWPPGWHLNAIHRDTLNSLLNVTGHAKFVKTWLDKLEAEENAELEADAT